MNWNTVLNWVSKFVHLRGDLNGSRIVKNVAGLASLSVLGIMAYRNGTGWKSRSSVTP